jgi:prepilin-type N-terminal cleavage/methylation domain-containing protein
MHRSQITRVACPSPRPSPLGRERTIAHCLTESAFSLVEVMCAVAILGISLVGLTQGITAALKSSKESEVQTTAALIAAGQIETLRADGFIIEGETDGTCEEGLDLYQWKQSITTTEIDGLYDVQVTVENSKTGKTIYELQTLLFDPPLLLTSDDASTPKDRRKKREGRR